MASYRWKLAITKLSSETNSKLLTLESILRKHMLMLPSPYEPFDVMGRLNLFTWDGDWIVYDPTSDHAEVYGLGGLPNSAVCSPTSPHCVIVLSRKTVMMDTTSGSGFPLALRFPEHEMPRIWWTKDGSRFFAIGRGSEADPPAITFFDALGRRTGEEIPLNPACLVPYAEEEFKVVSRPGFSLTYPMGAHIGFHLDTWSRIEFDADSNLVYLEIYRPTSPPRKKEGMYQCEAKTIWASAELQLD